MGVHVTVRQSLFLQYVESRNQHTTSTNLCLDKFLRTEKEVLKHLKLMLIEWIVISVCLSIRSLVETCADYVCNVGNLTTLLLIVCLQLIVSFCCFSKESLANDGINLFCCDWNTLAETVDNLCEKATIDIGSIDNVIKLELSNGNSPNLATKSSNSFCHAFKVKDVYLLLGNSLTYLVNHEDNANVLILVEVASKIFL